MANINRRRFLHNAGALGLMSSAGALAGLSNSGAFAADTSGYKALVCVFLFGGMDHADTVLPFDRMSYDNLVNIRPELFNAYENGAAAGSRQFENLLALSPQNASNFGGRQFALPPQLGPLHTLFETGDAAIVGGVGPLVEPVTRAEIADNTALLPARLFSHNDQQSTWLSLAPEGARFGWGGQFLDRANLGANAARFSAVSTGGNTSFLAGEETRQFQISTNGALEFDIIRQRFRLGSARNSDEARRLLREHFASQGVNADNLYASDIVDMNARTVGNNQDFQEASESALEFTTAFPQSRLGSQLRAAAEAISIQNVLGVNRQIFFVSAGGFDTHSGQVNALPNLHTEIAEAISAFHTAMGEINMNQNVTLFTASDFGRTMNDNGDGTDHGWGGHHFVVGGAVNGRRIYGDMAEIDLEADTYTPSRGRLIPAVSVEQYAATLGAWFGLDTDELASAFPNLANFETANLGFV
ncbi:MAG: DUF1501 domain-containing protein [Pseudomonadota bacterium]